MRHANNVKKGAKECAKLTSNSAALLKNAAELTNKRADLILAEMEKVKVQREALPAKIQDPTTRDLNSPTAHEGLDNKNP